jgi:hypothetical protein
LVLKKPREEEKLQVLKEILFILLMQDKIQSNSYVEVKISLLKAFYILVNFVSLQLPQVMDKLYLCLKARTVSQAHRSFKLSIANLTSSDSLDNCSDVVNFCKFLFDLIKLCIWKFTYRYRMFMKLFID